MRIGFCGLGAMGAPMAGHLLEAGRALTVWNRDPNKAVELGRAGAVTADSPFELAERSEIVILCVTDQNAVEQVVFGERGIAASRRPRHLIDHSSISVDAARAFAQRLETSSGAAWVDAPVSGGLGGARSGQLVVMAGGSAEDIAAVTPILAAYAKTVTRMGPTGAGQATKLCNQTIVSITIAAISEAVALAEAAGVDASKLAAALAGGWADSVLLQLFAPRMSGVEHGFLASIGLMRKDLENIGAEAEARAIVAPMLEACLAKYRGAIAQGLGDADLSQLVQVSRPRA
jgi:2-hydroxy-3-oxopropionate reductase